MPMDATWSQVLTLAWDAYCAGTVPVGAVVVAEGRVVSEGRNRRHEATAPGGLLANTRVAHAELNALAALPPDAPCSGYDLYSNVEPCCLCMGGAIHSGVRAVHFAWPDRYAGATGMIVDNVQSRRRTPAVHGSGPDDVRLVTAALVACHYLFVRPEHAAVLDDWLLDDADFLQRVERGATAEFVQLAALNKVPAAPVVAGLIERLKENR